MSPEVLREIERELRGGKVLLRVSRREVDVDWKGRLRECADFDSSESSSECNGRVSYFGEGDVRLAYRMRHLSSLSLSSSSSDRERAEGGEFLGV